MEKKILGVGVWNLDVSVDPAPQFVPALYVVICSAWTSAALLDRDSSSLSGRVKLEV